MDGKVKHFLRDSGFFWRIGIKTFIKATGPSSGPKEDMVISGSRTLLVLRMLRHQWHQVSMSEVQGALCERG